MILKNLEELKRNLHRDKLEPVYVLLGPDRYQCRLALDILKQSILAPETISFDLTEFVGGEAQIDEVIESVNTFPMMSKRRLVLVSDMHKLKDSEQEKILDSLDSFPRRSMLVLIGDDLDRRKRFYRILRDKGCVLQFPKLKGFALEQWALDFVRQRGYRISPDSIKKIIAAAGTDLQTLANEIEKLLLYLGKSKRVADSAIHDIVRGSGQNTIFELIDAMGSRDRAGALRLLANLLDSGEHPLYVVTMMARHCRQVLIAKDHIRRGSDPSEIGSAAQVHPYFLDQFLKQARAADSAAIQRMVIELADLDRKLKSSSADGRMLLEKLICSLV